MVRGRAPAGSVAMAAMHLFTLEFEQSDIEAAYVADRFARTSGAVERRGASSPHRRRALPSGEPQPLTSRAVAL